MKSEIGLQFSIVGRPPIVRAAALVVGTMALGLMLAIVFGRPLTASTPTNATSPAREHIRKTGPWVYPPVLTRV